MTQAIRGSSPDGHYILGIASCNPDIWHKSNFMIENSLGVHLPWSGSLIGECLVRIKDSRPERSRIFGYNPHSYLPHLKGHKIQDVRLHLTRL